MGLLAAAIGAYAQSTPYTDANTGISLEGYTDTTGFQFGMAASTTLGSDFIGQMVSMALLDLPRSSANKIRSFPAMAQAVEEFPSLVRWLEVF